MHRRSLARLVAVFAVITAGVGLVAPAARADANLPSLNLPPTLVAADSGTTPFTFTTANNNVAQSGTATFNFSGITNLTAADIVLTCDGNNGSYVTGSNVSFSCPLGTGTSHTGTLGVKRGPIGSRVVAGTLHVVVTTTFSTVGVIPGSSGTNSGDIALDTPPSATEDLTSIRADGQPHDVPVHLLNHSPVTGELARLDVAFSGLTGLSPSTLTVTDLNGNTVPVSGTTTLTAELSPHTGVPLADDADVTAPYRITIDPSVHGGSVTVDLTLDKVDSSGALVGQLDEDKHAVTVVNKPSVVPNLPATIRIGDSTNQTYPAMFTQQVGNKSGTSYPKAEVVYTLTLPAGMTSSQVTLSYEPSGSAPFTVLPWTVNGQVLTAKTATFSLPDSNSTIATPFKLEVGSGAPSGPLKWQVTVNDQASSDALLSDIAVPTTVAQKSPGVVGTPTAVGGNKKLIVSFDPGDNGSVDPTTYVVTATPSLGGAPVTGSGTSIPVTVTGLVNNTKYNLTVHATNVYGSSPQESPMGTGTPLATPPAAPTIVKLEPFDGYAVATVANPIDDGGSVITSYRASYVRTDGSAGGSSVIEDASDSTITLPGLTNGVSYTVTVRAVNAIGAGASSAPVTVIPNLPGGPTSPAGIRISLGATAATIASGSSVILSGAVVRNSDPQPKMTVAIRFTGADKKTTLLKTVTTDSLGSFEWKTKPTINGAWTASVTSVSPAVSSPVVPIHVTAVLKGVKLVRSGRTLTATGFVTPGFSLKKVSAPRVTIQLVKIVTVSHVKVTRVIKTLVQKKALDNTKSGNPFSLSAKVGPGSYLVRVATTSTYLLTSGASKPATVRVL